MEMGASRGVTARKPGSPPRRHGSLILRLTRWWFPPPYMTIRNGSPMELEKRRFVRKRTDQLLYAELGPDNGSILLNLCEAGCSFQSIAPVREEQVRFTVSVGDGRKLEGDGQIAWSDATKKTGGLRFLNPSPELQEQIREWLEETLVTADGTLDPAALDSNAKRRRKKLREEARAEAELTWQKGAVKAVMKETTAETAGHGLRMSVSETATTHVISNAGAAGDSTSRPGYGNSTDTWRGVGMIALLAMLFMALVAYRRELGHLVMSFGSSIAGDEQKAGPTMEVRPVPSNPVSEAQPTALSDEQGTKETGAEAAPASNEQLTPSANEQMSSPKRSSPQQTGAIEDVASLWTSVENGDTHAEVALANRYVRGEGVPQSCAQAQVLLEAAVKRGSAEAKQKLDELAQGGCP